MSQKYDFAVVNFANADMVGHTGNTDATVAAIEAVDKCLGQISDLVLSIGGALVVTADHGNAEELTNLETKDKDKEHSNNPVPCNIVKKDMAGVNVVGEESDHDLSVVPPTGILADVAPTILKIMEIEKPDEMTGAELI